MTTIVAPTADTVVARMATVYPRISDVPNPGIQKMLAMTLISYQPLGIEGTPDELFDRAYSEVMGMYAESDNAAKLLKEEKEKQTAAALDTFIAAHSQSIIDAALTVPAAYRPTTGWRILVSYDTAPVDPKTGNNLVDAENNALPKVPATIQFQPLNVKRIGAIGDRASTGSGRTIGVFRLEGTDTNVQLGEVAKSAGRADNENLTPRLWLEGKGWIIDKEANSDGVKFIHKPVATGK